MNTTYTPGPWTIDACGWPLIINDEQERVIAIIPSTDAIGLNCPPEEAEQHARLIAAAPAMVAKLARIHQYLSALRGLEAVTGATIDHEIETVGAILATLDGRPT